MSSPRQDDQRPRSKTMLSFTSHHSEKTHRSSGSHGKIDLTETSSEKPHLNTKADPSLAINEAQPSAVALEVSNLDNLRGVQHKDIHGNPIVDPDRSNPTRHRMERPLDTIRSFEAAIDGSYKRRASSYGSQPRPGSSQGLNGPFDSRRSSALFGYQQSNQSRGFPNGGYYGSRNTMDRPDSFIDQHTGPNQPMQGQGRGGRVNPRMNSEPMLNGGRPQQNVYPNHAYQQSYDTVNSAGSHQTDPYGNSTDPSSENSSLDRINAVPKQSEQKMIENHGFIGFGANQRQPQLDNYGGTQGPYGRAGYGTPGPSGQHRFEPGQDRPSPPPKETPRVPIKLDSQPGTSPLARQISDSPTEKRKSWFKRRFSKN